MCFVEACQAFHPGDVGHVDDAVVVQQVIAVLQSCVEYAEQAAGFSAVAFVAVVVGFAFGEDVEVSELAEHGAGVGGLKSQPLQAFQTGAVGMREELAGFVGQILQDNDAFH